MTTPPGPPQRRPGQSSPPERPAGESASRERGARRRDGTAFQSLSWFMARLLGVYYDIRVHRPPDLLDSPAGTRLILMPTHQSVLDPWLLINAFDRGEWRRLVPVRALATQTFEDGFLGRIRPLLKLLYRIAGAVVLPPRAAGLVSLHAKVRELIAALERGETVAIFPEGHVRTRTGPPISEFAPGVVHVHRETGAPIVPVAVWTGPERLPRRRFYIRVGRPIRVPPELSLHAATDWLRRRTIELYELAAPDRH